MSEENKPQEEIMCKIPQRYIIGLMQYLQDRPWKEVDGVLPILIAAVKETTPKIP